MTERTAPRECANCGAALSPRAKSCPECGADERTGWREQSIYDGLDLPDDSIERPSRRQEHRRFWLLVAAVLLPLMTWLLLRRWL